MRFVSFREDGRFRPALQYDHQLLPLDAIAPNLGLGDHEVASLRAFLQHFGVAGLRDFASEVERLGGASAAKTIALDQVSLGPPIPDPEKIICVGLNYVDHAHETDLEVPAVPVFFAKFANALAGHGDSVCVPRIASAALDYEAELAIVIGETTHNVDVTTAKERIVGAMVLNDLSARDLQFQTTQWFFGKGADGFAPCGPSLVTIDEVGDLSALEITTQVNHVTVQTGTTADMIFDPATIVARLSQILTLRAGDVISTGTPPGVGMSKVPPLRLQHGDRVDIEIERLGQLSTQICYCD